MVLRKEGRKKGHEEGRRERGEVTQLHQLGGAKFREGAFVLPSDLGKGRSP